MRVAITGGAAEGKSTVVAYMAALGLTTVSADDLAREAYNDPPVQEWIRFELGSTDRSKVRSALLHDSTFRRRLNSVTHPRILVKLRECMADVFEVPLLIETCLQPYFDVVWVVTCGHAEQLRRLEERLGSRTAAEAFLHTQLPTRAKFAFADRIVRTNSDEESVRRYVTEAVSRDFP